MLGLADRLAHLLAVEINAGQPHPPSFTGGVSVATTCRVAGLTTRHTRCRAMLADVVEACYQLDLSYRPAPHIQRALGWRPASQIISTQQRCTVRALDLAPIPSQRVDTRPEGAA